MALLYQALDVSIAIGTNVCCCYWHVFGLEGCRLICCSSCKHGHIFTYTISILIQVLYLLNQLHKQGLTVRGLTQLSMALVVARFQYTLPALAGQLSADDLHKVEDVFNKARRWQLTFHTPNSAHLLEQCDKRLFRAALMPLTVCIACCP